VAVNLHAYAREQLHDLFVCCLPATPCSAKELCRRDPCANKELCRRCPGRCIKLHVRDDEKVRNVVLLETLILDQLGNLLHGLYEEVCAHAPVGPLKTLHLLHKCRLLAKIMPLRIRRKGENPIAEDRVRDLRGEDAKSNCRFHGSSRHAARDVDHSDHTRETTGLKSIATSMATLSTVDCVQSFETVTGPRRCPRASPSAPARLKSEDKKFLEGLGVTFCASLSDDVRHKRADAGLVKTAHSLVEQGKERVPETLRRELCMPVLASPVRRGNGALCASMHHRGG
jgi:hypothetical protein